MKVFTIAKAQANIEAVIAAVRAGEEVYLARRTKPVAMVLHVKRLEYGMRQAGQHKRKTSPGNKKKR